MKKYTNIDQDNDTNLFEQDATFNEEEKKVNEFETKAQQQEYILLVKKSLSEEAIVINNDSYLMSFDDSSDEEDSKDIEKNYDVITKWQKIKLTDNHKLPFISHALGIQILYSNNIQNKYYNLKRKKLASKEEDLPNQEEIRKLTINILKNSFLEEYFWLPTGNEKARKVICNKFIETNKELINEFIDYVVVNKRKFFKLLARNTLVEEIQEYFFSQKINFKELVDQYIANDLINNKPELDTASAIVMNITNLKENQELVEKIEAIDRNAINKEVAKLLKTEKGRIKKIGAAQSGDKYIHKIIKEECDKLSGAASTNKFKARVTDIMLEYRLDMLIKNGEKSISYKHVKGLLVEMGLIKLDLEKIISILNKNLKNSSELSTTFVENLNKLKSQFIFNSQTSRKILEDSEIFNLSNIRNDFFSEFAATLRLCNRSIKRSLKNRKDLDEDYEYFKEEGLSRSWQFPAGKHHVNDIHRISTANKALRSDHIESIGTYKSVFKYIDQIKDLVNKKILSNKQKIGDEDIAYWIQLILKGDPLKQLPYSEIKDGASFVKIVHLPLKENILKDLVKISYLMFGPEVCRNPASLVHNSMALDLIRNNIISWKEAIDNCEKTTLGKIKADGGMIPMSMKEAVMAARTLQNLYNKYMPSIYTYDRFYHDDKSRMEELIKRENEITIKWLEMKLIKLDHDLSDYFTISQDNKKTIKDEKIYQFLKILQDVCKEWYGITIPIEAAYIKSELLIKITEELQNFDTDDEDLHARLKILEDAKAIDLLIDDLITFDDIMYIPFNILQECNKVDSIFEMIRSEHIELDDIYKLHNICQRYGDDFNQVLQNIVTILESREYDISDILKRYENDERHLEYMAGDPWDIFLNNLHNANQELLKFVLDNDYLESEDIEEIRDQLSEGQLMQFDCATGFYDNESDEVEITGADNDYYIVS